MSIECRETKSKVITSANHKSREPIKLNLEPRVSLQSADDHWERLFPTIRWPWSWIDTGHEIDQNLHPCSRRKARENMQSERVVFWFAAQESGAIFFYLISKRSNTNLTGKRIISVWLRKCFFTLIILFWFSCRRLTTAKLHKFFQTSQTNLAGRKEIFQTRIVNNNFNKNWRR